jgi:hypothetical protein
MVGNVEAGTRPHPPRPPLSTISPPDPPPPPPEGEGVRGTYTAAAAGIILHS